MSGGNVIADAVTAIGVLIAFYYGLTGFTCVWYYRRTLFSSPRNLFMRGILPLLGGLIMYFAGGWSIWLDWDVATQNSFTSWLMPFWPHWEIGGVFMIAFLSALAGVIAFIYCRITLPAYFRKETLTRSHPDPGPRNRPRPPRLAELAVLTRGGDPPAPPACAPRPRGGTSPTHRPLAGPEARNAPDRVSLQRAGLVARGSAVLADSSAAAPGSEARSLARGRPPEPPAALRVPRWYVADTPATRRARGPVRWAGNERPAVTRLGCSPIAPATRRARGPGSLGR